MANESPLHRALRSWRAAEHRLAQPQIGEAERIRLESEIDRLRASYQALFTEVEDVAAHAAANPDEEHAPSR